jgi:L-ascorbate metabolism protein UlaG (beta-lactamase superfamily)
MRHFDDSDACGFRFETTDGTIWAPGDTRLMDVHLHQPTPDALFMDLSEDKWPFTLAGAAKLANAYPKTPILLSHWGTIDAPNFPPFNGDPSKLRALLVNPERMQILAPGQPYILRRLKKI